MKKIVLVLAGVIFMIGFGNYALAQMCGTSCEAPSKAGYAEAAETAVMANNGYCPVTGEEIQKGHEQDVTCEYNGKIYSFCCDGCIAPFKKNPEEYLKKLDKMLEQEEKKAQTLQDKQ